VDCRGFTLVEILVALFIFSMVFLPLTAVLTAESKFERLHERKMTALLVAKNELEKSKKRWGKETAEEYQVVMAGTVWNVARTVENAGDALADSAACYGKRFVTVRVGAEKDTATLAELRVVKETYR
jgi:type II secretion system protein I